MIESNKVKKGFYIVSFFVVWLLGSNWGFSQTTLYSENFETAPNNAICTTAVINWLENPTNEATDWGTSSTGVITGTRSLTLRDGNSVWNDYTWNDACNMIVYNTVSISSAGYNTLKLNFKWKAFGEPDDGFNSGQPYDYGMICYSTSGSGGPWVNITTGGPLGNGKYFNTSAATTVTNFSLPSALDNTSFLFGFRWINDAATGTAPGFTIDDISITGVPIALPGNAYGIYAPGAISGVVDCEIYAVGGTGTPASTGCKVCSPTSTGYTNVNISNTTSFPIIIAGDGTNNNTNCTAKNMNMTTGAGSPTWTFTGGTPASGSGSPLAVQYAATGRKNVIMNGSTYTGFNNITTAAPSSGSILSAYTNGCPGAYYFSSSIGSATGYGFSWTEVHTGGGAVTVSFSPANTYSSNVTFTNSSSTVQTVTITVTPSSECCGTLTAVTYTFNINPLPNAPVITPSSATICPGGSALLTATSPANCSFDWYTVSTGGTPFASGPSCTVSPGSTTTYYCESTNAYGCLSTTRASVVVTVTPTTPPTVPAISTCGPNNVTLAVSSPVAGATYNFYSANCSGLLQSSSSSSYTFYLSATTTYYVSVTLPGCNESACTAVVATVNAAPGTMTWTGTGATGANNWFDPVNWGGCGVPTCGINVIINNLGAGANYPDIGFNSGVAASCRNFTLNNTNASLTFSDVNSVLEVCGDFENHSIINVNGKGFIKFIGTTPQSFSMSSPAVVNGDFNDIILANTAAPLPSLTIKTATGNQDMIISTTGHFTFQTGVLITEGARKLVVNNTASSALNGHGASAYVYGRLKRAVVAGSAYDFPVGGNPSGTTVYPYQLMNINFNSVTGLSNLTVVFDNPNNSTGNNLNISPTLVEPTQTSVDYNILLNNGGPNTNAGFPSNPGTVTGIWTVIPDAGTATYTMTVYGINYDNAIYAGSNYSIMKRSTHSMCGTIPSWTLDGFPLAGTTTGNTITCTRYGMSGFSQFAIGRSPQPLPVELLAFDAACALVD